MNKVIFLVSILLYPIISGPVATLAFIIILRLRKQWAMVLFWLSLVALNVAGFFYLALTLGDFFAGPGFFACMITPIFAIVTVLVSRLLVRRLHQAIGGDDKRQRWLTVGTLLIAFLQIATVFALALLAPWLCEIGIRNCSEL
ncbi:MAG: hypothetical protein P8Z40_12470 [Chloroflexota bacterium]